MATSVTFDTERDLMLLEDDDKFRLYIQPDIWTSILDQDIHTDIDNLAKLLWLFAYHDSGITLTGFGYIIAIQPPPRSMLEIPLFIRNMSFSFDTEMLEQQIHSMLQQESDNQEFRQIGPSFNSDMIAWLADDPELPIY